MNLEDLKNEAARLFPMATENALERPGAKNPALGTLRALCWEHFRGLGFGCMADCFAAIVPKIRGSVSLDAWSSAEITVAPWTFRLECRPFWIGSDQVHLTIRHDSPLPGVTETGYLSMFLPMAAFAEGGTPEEHVAAMFPQEAQLALL